MSEITYDYMEEYIRNLIPEGDKKFKDLEEFAKINKVPIAQKETAKFLEFIVSMKKPLRILELGTAIGYSAILMHEASGYKSFITTVERDENMIEYARENFKKYNLEDKIEIIQGDCLDVLENLDGKYDLIFMDAGKGHYNHFLPNCLRLLSDDGIMVKRRKITIVKRMREYLELVSKDENLITSVIPMGDGIAVTKRR